MTVELKLTNGFVALIDSDDYERVMLHKWYAKKAPDTMYARNTQRNLIYLHRYIMNVQDRKIKVDHIDHDGLNNTKSNLRLSSHSDNLKNRRKAHGTSKYMGVSYHNTTGKWIARININGKQKHIGLFKNEIDAANAFNIAALATGNPHYTLNIL